MNISKNLLSNVEIGVVTVQTIETIINVGCIVEHMDIEMVNEVLYGIIQDVYASNKQHIIIYFRFNQEDL